MTIEEYRQAVASLSHEEFVAFVASWGADESVEGCVQAFVYATDPIQWERIAIFRLRQRGVTHLLTEHEKLVAAAMASASSAKVSADSAASSAGSAAESVRWSFWSVVVAIVTVLVALIAIVFSGGIALLTRK